MKTNFEQQAIELLKEKQLRVTEARRQILAEYLETKKPLSIFDFKKKKIFQSWDESSLYRNISKLEEAGLIQGVPSSKDIKFYELASAREHHHHHHITCTQCNTVECLHDCGIDHLLKKMAASVGFVMKGHTLELTGLCQQCSSQKS